MMAVNSGEGGTRDEADLPRDEADDGHAPHVHVFCDAVDGLPPGMIRTAFNRGRLIGRPPFFVGMPAEC